MTRPRMFLRRIALHPFKENPSHIPVRDYFPTAAQHRVFYTCAFVSTSRLDLWSRVSKSLSFSLFSRLCCLSEHVLLILLWRNSEARFWQMVTSSVCCSRFGWKVWRMEDPVCSGRKKRTWRWNVRNDWWWNIVFFVFFHRIGNGKKKKGEKNCNLLLLMREDERDTKGEVIVMCSGWMQRD